MIHANKIFLVLAATAFSQPMPSPFEGRWDFTVKAPNGSYPSWMEYAQSDGTAHIRIQPRSGGVRAVTSFRQEGSHLILVRPDVVWDLQALDGRLIGTQKRADAVTGELTGVRAPVLARHPPAEWTAPEPLFNGKDLTGWEPDQPDKNHWVARDGVLINEEHGANLKTTRKFDDFRLHVEFNCPEKGNSGLYLRGRYEVQIEYEPAGTEDGLHSMGSIYGFVAPKVEMPRKAGQWESFDITLVGRRVTIVRNDVKTVDDREIPGITGGALDSDEGKPGPFYIQGDHTGDMRFRNIRVAVPKS